MKKVISILLTLGLIVTALAACASGTPSTSGSEAATASSQGTEAAADTQSGVEVKRVLVGTSGSTKPYIFTDDNGNLVGYDAEVLQAVSKLLPQYKFEYEFTEFPSIFLGLDAGQYQMAVNNLSYKKERAEKYLFSDEYVGYNTTGVIVRNGDTSIQTLEDLGGKKTYTGTSGLFSQVFEEKYNEEHPDNPIELLYSDADSIKQYQDLVNGVIDFSFVERVMFDFTVQSYPDLKAALDFVEFTPEETSEIQDPYTWFLYPKTEFGEQLKADVDSALRQLKQDGTIKEISLKWLGYDSTVY